MLFEPQTSRKPNLYPWADEFIASMWHGFWTPSEFTFLGDLGQFKSEMSEEEQQIVVRTLSAIGQVEIAVKKFWARLGDNLPHPSISDLGFVMANTEVIHNKAYEKLLDVLGMEHVFEENLKVPEVIGRVKYLTKHLDKKYEDDKRQYIYSLILFTLFVENVSLFSQFYVILWFNRNKNWLKDTAQQVQYTRQEECYVAGTEILTPSGWRLLSDMSDGDLVYQYNADGTLEETKVIHTVRRQYSGDVIKFSRKGNACVVTPDHEMVVFYEGDSPAGCGFNGPFRRIKAKDVKMHKKMCMPRSAVLKGGNVDTLTDEERLFLAVQADGNRMYWTNSAGERIPRGKDGGCNYGISVLKDRKIDRLRMLLKSTGVSYQESKISKSGYVLFRMRIDTSHDLKRLDWVDLSGKSAAWCRDFVDELSKWDGWVLPGGLKGYCSKVRENIDLVHQIGILAGYHVKLTHKVDSRSDTYSDTWKVHFSDSNPKPISHGIKKHVVPYEGEVACVSVPSGAILTRYEDETFISGNCIHSQVGMKIISTLRAEYPDLFDEELEALVKREARKAIAAEEKLIDWIMGSYQEKGISARILKSYIGKRMNESLTQIGFKPAVKVDESLIPETEWMDVELYGNTMTDFFHKKPVEYAKHNRSYNVEDIF